MLDTMINYDSYASGQLSVLRVHVLGCECTLCWYYEAVCIC